GLQSNIYEGLKYRDFPSLTEAAKAARYAESQIFREDLQVIPHQNIVSSNNNREMDDLRKELHDLHQLIVQKNSKKNDQPRCLHCKGDSHVTADCKAPECYVCGNLGHIPQHCPKRQNEWASQRR
uniref:CCHC-type domain-containing protein n=1 Tax=Romanomermis culicivorax TaxID=13658 RepID=A0A915HLM8_ROMCU